LDADNLKFDSTDNLDHCGSKYENSCELHAKIQAKVRGKVQTKIRGDAAGAEASLLVILKFFVPGHLNRFQLSFVR